MIKYKEANEEFHLMTTLLKEKVFAACLEIGR